MQIAFIGILYPSVMISYFGQSAWLIKNPSGYATSFFASIPWGDGFFYFYFVVAVLAACVASQTMISAAYSIVRQSMALRCFPRMKVIHTSTKVSSFCCVITVLAQHRSCTHYTEAPRWTTLAMALGCLPGMKVISTSTKVGSICHGIGVLSKNDSHTRKRQGEQLLLWH